MKPLAAILIAPLLLVIQSLPARATCSGPSCKKTSIMSNDCTEISGETAIEQSLYFLADCEYYCDPSMGPEFITRHPLVESNYVILKKSNSGDYSPIDGAFVRASQCGGLPVFRFDGGLEPNTNYAIQATSQDYPGLELILAEFKTAPATRGLPDGGAPPEQPDSRISSADDSAGCSLTSHCSSSDSLVVFLVLLFVLSRRTRRAFRIRSAL